MGERLFELQQQGPWTVTLVLALFAALGATILHRVGGAVLRRAMRGTPIISDYWEGLDSFFDFGTEILVSYSARDTLQFLRDLPEAERQAIGERARQKVLNAHTAAHRALEVEQYVRELTGALKPVSCLK